MKRTIADLELDRAIARMRGAMSPPRGLSRAERDLAVIGDDINKLAAQALLLDYQADPSGARVPRLMAVVCGSDSPSQVHSRSRPEEARQLLGDRSSLETASRPRRQEVARILGRRRDQRRP